MQNTQKLKLVIAPDPVLTTRSREVEKVDDEIRQIIDAMVKVTQEEDASGLAANQVGLTKRIIIIDLSDDHKNYGSKFPLPMVNPKIISSSGNYIKSQEGCLSLPGQYITVDRLEKITVEYLDYNNNSQTIEADGLFSRVIQHEIDHLDGKLMIDYLSNLKKSMALKKLAKIKKLQQKVA